MFFRFCCFRLISYSLSCNASLQCIASDAKLRFASVYCLRFQNAMNVARHKKLVPEIEGFEIPSWSGKPSSGLHLDVLKEKEGEVKMISKMMVDEKNAYFFGRNPLYCDFPIDHASCSRVHAVLLFHKNLNKSFLVDLNSAHGTFIGKVRLESFKPTQIHPGKYCSSYVYRSSCMIFDEAFLVKKVD